MSGPECGGGGPVLVSVTDFVLHRGRDLLPVYREGRRLGSRWRELDGAYGMWLWALPGARRCGAVAVWRDEAALHGFVGWPPHVEIMRAYREKGALTSRSWGSEVSDPAVIWGRARAELLVPPGPRPGERSSA
ncbi:hypothetical protein [Streptomyces finlayi]|uniref:hypothetical protein n=1 Tax=Streptomyces finlayi TaxID=67296 RepID=UPI001E363E53|nr:hypothetical protein [Streptomyces finlayi]